MSSLPSLLVALPAVCSGALPASPLIGLAAALVPGAFAALPVLGAAPFGLDPATVELLRSGALASGLLCGAGGALALLPWSTAEVDRVHQAAAQLGARLLPAAGPSPAPAVAGGPSPAAPPAP
jgi:hypothetical protein